MRIDECGANSEKLKEIYTTIIKNKQSNDDIDKDTGEIVDSDLYQAYQNILSIANDGNAIALALDNLSKRVERGTIDTTELPSLGINAAVQAVIETNNSVLPGLESVKENIAANTVVFAMAIAGGELNQKEEYLFNFFSVPEYENAVNELLPEVQQEDFNAMKAFDLIEHSEKFIMQKAEKETKEKPYTEGEKVAALTYIYQLVSTGQPAALMNAEKLVQTFGLDEVLEDGKINLDKVKEAFLKKSPTHDLDKISKDRDNRIIANKDAIKASAAVPHKDRVVKKIEDQRITEFSTKLTHEIKQGNYDVVSSMIKENPELAKKVYEKTKELYKHATQMEKRSKTGEDILMSKLTAIGMALGKDVLQKGENPEEDMDRG